MSYKIFRIEDLDNKNFFYQSSKKINFNDKKVVFIPIVYKNDNSILPILFQIPSIKLNDSYKKDNLLLPINTVNTNKTMILKNFFNNLDEKFIYDFKTNGKNWCKEVLQNLKNFEYKALVNIIEDNEPVYDNGVLNLQLEDIETKFFNKNNSAVKVYNEKKELVNEENYRDVLQKGNIIQCILEVKGLIITYSEKTDETNEIFPYIKTHQIRYHDEKILDVELPTYSFIESEIEPVAKYDNNLKNNENINNVNNIDNNTSEEEESAEESEGEEDYNDVNESESEEDSNSDIQTKNIEILDVNIPNKEIYKDRNGNYIVNEYSSDSSDSNSEILKKIAKELSSEEKKTKPKRKYTKKNNKK